MNSSCIAVDSCFYTLVLQPRTRKRPGSTVAAPAKECPACPFCEIRLLLVLKSNTKPPVVACFYCWRRNIPFKNSLATPSTIQPSWMATFSTSTASTLVFLGAARAAHQSNDHLPTLRPFSRQFNLSHYNWLVVWLPCFIFPYIKGIIIPTDFHIFQKGSNHQPDKIIMPFILWTSSTQHNFHGTMAKSGLPCEMILPF